MTDKEERQYRGAVAGASLISLLALAVALAALIVTIVGCAPVQTPEGPILVAPEAKGARFAADVERWTGVRPDAFTLPLECVPPIYLDRAAAEDACARLHEATHVRQRSAEPREVIVLNYAGEFARCWRAARWARDAFDGCYRGVSYEREAYEVQRACVAARAARDGGLSP